MNEITFFLFLSFPSDEKKKIAEQLIAKYNENPGCIVSCLNNLIKQILHF